MGGGPAGLVGATGRTGGAAEASCGTGRDLAKTWGDASPNCTRMGVAAL